MFVSAFFVHLVGSFWLKVFLSPPSLCDIHIKGAIFSPSFYSFILFLFPSCLHFVVFCSDIYQYLVCFFFLENVKVAEIPVFLLFWYLSGTGIWVFFFSEHRYKNNKKYTSLVFRKITPDINPRQKSILKGNKNWQVQ